MKKIVIAFVTALLLFTASYVSAQTAGSNVKLMWDANTEPELSGYKVYYGTASKVYTVNKDVGNVTTYQFNGLPDATYYFVATAYDATKLESDYSNEVVWTVDTVAPVITKITVSREIGSRVIGVTIAATDLNGVTGYLVTPNSTTPLATGPGWVLVPTISYTLATGNNTVYTWAKDEKGNISNYVKVTIIASPKNLKVN